MTDTLSAIFAYGSLGSFDTALGAARKCYSPQRLVVLHNRMKPGEKEVAQSLVLRRFNGECNIEWVDTGFVDLFTAEENNAFLDLVLKVAGKELSSGYSVAISIAGGRKTMSSLLLVAAQLLGIKYVFHAVVDRKWESNPDVPINEQVPESEIQVIHMPVLQVSGLLEHLLRYQDEENRYQASLVQLIGELKSAEAFDKLNKYLFQQVRRRKWKEQYVSLAPRYTALMEAVIMIVRERLAGRLMYQPNYESRLKDFNSLYKKILKREQVEIITDPFSRFSDIAGIRVIFFNARDMDTALQILTASGDLVNAGTGGPILPDNKSSSLGNGYRALHLDVQIEPTRRGSLPEYQPLIGLSCEIQFKTVFAHAWSKVHHAIVYKREEESAADIKFTTAIEADFREAANRLESIESFITGLCFRYHPQMLANRNKED